MRIVIEYFPDRKRPCIMLEEGNVGVIIGSLSNEKWEKMLRKACGIGEKRILGIALSDCKYTLEELLKEEE